jgi:oligoendopeptidase F
MTSPLPTKTEDLLAWTWPQIEPHYEDLERQRLSAKNVEHWLTAWTRLSEDVSELRERLYVATTVNTADELASTRYDAYLDTIQENAEAAEQRLKEKLLASGLEPKGFEIPLRNMRTEAALFREQNLPLLAENDKHCTEYDRIVGAQTVTWEGKELTLSQLQPFYQDHDRAKREKAWRLSMDRWLQDRSAICKLWATFLRLRLKIASNAGFGDDYRSYRWQQMLRFDYSPADCRSFHDAIEAIAVPAATRVYERRRKRLGLDILRPWDLYVDPLGRPPLRPYESLDELISKTSAIFHHVDPQLGTYFDVMRQEGLLDLENRKNKAPGGYCTDYMAVRRPFIFTNAVKLHDDVQTLLHEGGHAFHCFESARLPYIQQLGVGMEFAEVASMGMELLASPYLTADQGGFYTAADAARAIVEHLEGNITFWPYMAVVDAFQHWVYENPQAALDPAQCDTQWAAQWKRFMPGVDYSGLDDEMMTGWQRKLHIHQTPFYYVEYGLAQLGATQVWANALHDQAQAVASYRRALALGGTVTLPELYAKAGARFAFDADTLRAAVHLTEREIARLER